MEKKTIVRTALSGLVALAGVTVATSAQAAPGWAKPGDAIEKCAGVAKTGKNDCGTSKHGCGGKATKDNDPEEWV